MTNAKTTYRYFEVCPRGFANEVTFYRVPTDKAAEVEREYEDYNDDPNASCGWTKDRRARLPGVAIDWADRNY